MAEKAGAGKNVMYDNALSSYDVDEVINLEEELAKIRKRNAADLRQKEEKAAIKQAEALAEYKIELQKAGIVLTSKLEAEFLKKNQKKEDAEKKKSQIEFFKEYSKLSQKEEKKKEKQLDKELKIAKLRSTVTETGEDKSGLKKIGDNIAADFKENAAMMGNSFKDVGKGMIKGFANLGDKLSGEINAVISSYSQYQSAINTRLQGTNSTFQSIEKKLTSTLGMSPYVKTSSMLENLNELVSQGIAFNLEQRAFLDTISDKIATTFDIADASLLRIIKLQQADSSASRLGMEAYLTRYYNDMFQNTEYLSTTFDSVTASLLEATSQMGTKQSVEFEYVVQKWLGSLSAVGTSQSTIQAIAEALGYLGSGNITALSGSTMQNLFVMAASRAGLDYSAMLTGGIDQKSTNELLQSVVGYMQEIGKTSNQVVKSQFAQTFGITVSDLTAVANISTDDLSTITKNMMSYTGTLDELSYQLDQVSSRVSVAEKIQNLMTNIKFGIGQGIAQSPTMAGMWSITDLIQGVTGGIAIPAISVMGNMVDLNTTVENLVKTGLVGVSTFGKIGDLFTGLSNAASMSGLMNADWSAEKGNQTLSQLQTTRRGTMTRELNKRGLDVSASTYIGTTSGAEIGGQTLQAAQAEAGTVAAQKKAESVEKSTTDIYKYLLDMFDPKMNSLLTMMGSLSGYGVNVQTFDTGKEKRDYVFNYGTQVSVSAPSESETGHLAGITSDVHGIYTLLQTGIIKVVLSDTLTGGTNIDKLVDAMSGAR